MSYSCCSSDFPDWSSLKKHIGTALPHRACRRCRGGFQSLDILQEHLRTSGIHNETHVGSPIATSQTQNVAAAFGPPILPQVDILLYSGIPSHKVKIIFQAACIYRHRRPQAEDIIHVTGIDLDREVVSAILEGALRLLPPDRSTEGDFLRCEKEAIRAAHANAAEDSFVEAIRAWHQAGMRDERQQTMDIRQAMENGIENIVKLTPDIIFDTPARFNGKLVFWMEFKNTFGFRKNPFVHGKHMKQVKRYRAALGPGVIVYKLGYEQNLFQIEGVECFREADVLSAIDERADL